MVISSSHQNLLLNDCNIQEKLNRWCAILRKQALKRDNAKVLNQDKWQRTELNISPNLIFKVQKKSCLRQNISNEVSHGRGIALFICSKVKISLVSKPLHCLLFKIHLCNNCSNVIILCASTSWKHYKQLDTGRIWHIGWTGSKRRCENQLMNTFFSLIGFPPKLHLLLLFLLCLFELWL